MKFLTVNVDFLLTQVKSGTIFDNFLITNDPKLAEEVGNDMWGKTKVSAEFYFTACISLMHLSIE